MDTSSLPQSIRLAGVRNARELGGYAAPDNQHVRRGVLLRTAHLAAASGEDVRRLREEFRLSCIVDFRTTAEWAAQPDTDVPGAASYHLLVVDESDPGGSIARDTAQFQRGDYHQVLLDLVSSGRYNINIYVDMLLSPWGLEAYRAFFRLLLRNDSGSALLFHCTAGKDRTGVAAMLILLALGASDETICADYARTNLCRAAEIEKAMADHAAEIAADPAQRMRWQTSAGVDPETAPFVLRTIRQDYGSAESYLEAEYGLTPARLMRLRRMYLE